jgi:hypothetical protein
MRATCQSSTETAKIPETIFLLWAHRCLGGACASAQHAALSTHAAVPAPVVGAGGDAMLLSVETTALRSCYNLRRIRRAHQHRCRERGVCSPVAVVVGGWVVQRTVPSFPLCSSTHAAEREVKSKHVNATLDHS